jgi:isoleucyl-tRNA synthetase
MKPVYGKQSVHLLEFPEADSSLIDEGLEKEMNILRKIYETAAAARMKQGIKLRQPVKRLIVYTDREEIVEAVSRNIELVKAITNSKEVLVEPLRLMGEIVRYKVEPVYKSIGPRYRSLTKQVLRYIEENQERIASDILNNGKHEADVNGLRIVLTKDDVVVTPYYIKGYSVEDAEWGSVAIDTVLSEGEIAEGIARDLVRRIQVMRKMLNLQLDARIKTTIMTPPDKMQLVEKMSSYIMNETRSIELKIMPGYNGRDSLRGFTQSWDINDEEYIIGIEVV